MEPTLPILAFHHRHPRRYELDIARTLLAQRRHQRAKRRHLLILTEHSRYRHPQIDIRARQAQPGHSGTKHEELCARSQRCTDGALDSPAS
eukprot:4170021-Prymnesium_polylepis.1